ncbi:endonuclease/exonuclease/phosphatase family protein [Persicimonas caeni]|uniref:Endonuclease/exonuclease/phosphatase family protein n=1 Tax=Persicimonas caeni TaxID=2292766 RepID=A0A4Y6Q0U3_PERCE|nr:endonuclease/exonuclease/phosphatase family protein [Persicimonas caeni]QDG53615.1 endonuclease/exonuclease/phosphatase family protein [Persicimonas caeni]QED34836.1 endonuclease/exonuclease/phosphatase family protein [Persicimonas caeni]
MFHPRLFSLLTFLLATSLSASCSTPKPRSEPAPNQPHVRVMSYNVNYGLAGDPAAIEAIRRGGTDVVFLQETTPAWETKLREELAADYPYMHFRHCCGAGGLAVLSKHPLRLADYMQAPRGGWFPGWRVVVDSPIGELQVLNVHLRPPVSDTGSVVSGYFSTGDIRRRQIETFWEKVDPEMPTLVVGDFNEDTDGDALEFLATRGLESALPEFEPSAQTWRWPTSVGQIDSRLDHVVYDERLRPLDARVLQAGRSDHLPVVATFVLGD